MALTKQQKIGYLVRAFERQRVARLVGETDALFVQRVITEKLQKYKTDLLTTLIRGQERFETQTSLDVSDL